MHEYHAVEALAKQLIAKAKENKARRILRVRLVLGEFSDFSEESIRLYFEQAAAGTLLEGAQILIRRAKGKGRDFYVEDMDIEN
jgi:Zn finger protein HypA/HybF involved in hydrogenase expression